MDPLVTSWESAIGPVTITTHRGNGQSVAAWTQQHADAVAEALDRWPEI